MSWRGLSTRLAKVEKRQRVRRRFPAIIFVVYEDEAPGRLSGLATLTSRCDRAEGEDDFAAFVARALATLGAPRFAHAVYAASAHQIGP